MVSSLYLLGNTLDALGKGRVGGEMSCAVKGSSRSLRERIAARQPPL